MAKYTDKFKKFIVDERLIEKKGYVLIEREHGIRRGTAFQWVKKYENGTLFIDFRETSSSIDQQNKEYEFLKKSFALLKEIRSKRQE